MTTLRISAEYTWNGLNTRSPFSGKDAASSATELEESGFHSSADASSDSMMSAHFVHQGKNDSKYTLARKNGQNALAMQRNRQDSILSMAMTELATLGDEQGGYAKRSLIGRRAARRMSEEQQTAVREHSERNLEGNRKAGRGGDNAPRRYCTGKDGFSGKSRFRSSGRKRKQLWRVFRSIRFRASGPDSGCSIGRRWRRLPTLACPLHRHLRLIFLFLWRRGLYLWHGAVPLFPFNSSAAGFPS